MLFDLPDPDTLCAALLARDARFDGMAFVCVAATGISCRLTCPARTARRENCGFLATAWECRSAGDRPCKRCHPLGAGADPAVKRLLQALQDRPELRWSERDGAALGVDPSTVRRAFRRRFGRTFLDLARLRRLRSGVTTLAAGGEVIAAQHEASFGSASALRAAFARLLGCAGQAEPRRRAAGQMDRHAAGGHDRGRAPQPPAPAGGPRPQGPAGGADGAAGRRAREDRGRQLSARRSGVNGRVPCGAAGHRSRRASGVGARLRGVAVRRDTGATARLALSFDGHLALSPPGHRVHEGGIEGMTMLRTSHRNRPRHRAQAAACGAVLRTVGGVRAMFPVTVWRQRKP